VAQHQRQSRRDDRHHRVDRELYGEQGCRPYRCGGHAPQHAALTVDDQGGRQRAECERRHRQQDHHPGKPALDDNRRVLAVLAFLNEK
jgi:hypothetical protein